MFVEILEKYNKKDNWWLWLFMFCSAVWRFMILLSGCARVDWSACLLYNLYISEHVLNVLAFTVKDYQLYYFYVNPMPSIIHIISCILMM